MPIKVSQLSLSQNLYKLQTLSKSILIKQFKTTEHLNSSSWLDLFFKWQLSFSYISYYFSDCSSSFGNRLCGWRRQWLDNQFPLQNFVVAVYKYPAGVYNVHGADLISFQNCTQSSTRLVLQYAYRQYSFEFHLKLS